MWDAVRGRDAFTLSAVRESCKLKSVIELRGSRLVDVIFSDRVFDSKDSRGLIIGEKAHELLFMRLEIYWVTAETGRARETFRFELISAIAFSTPLHVFRS